MSEWEREQLPLDPDHRWRARPGCKVFVAGGGAVRFDFPESWCVAPDADSIKLYDRPPPDDDCRLAVSCHRLPPITGAGPSLAQLVQAALQGDGRPLDRWGPVHEGRQADLEWAWQEADFLDPTLGRQAKTRLCIARRGALQALLTLDFWAVDLARVEGVWDTALETLVLGRYIDDPTRGPADE
ncbi:MAG: hypothetical protein AB1505_11105 [Candidatus Latescibacterota bacterium]